MENSSLMLKVTNLPRRPGVYIYRNAEGKIIYIGKAKSLKDRVKSYFVLDIAPGSKTAALVRQITDMEYLEVETEFDALILESELIKKHRPKYNIQLKDDKSALYIVIRNELVVLDGEKLKLPRIITERETDLMQGDTSFGPYTDGKVAKYVVRQLRRMYPYRDCSTSKFQRYEKLNQPCLYGHLGLCSAPCTKRVSVEDYKKDIKKIILMLQGKSRGVLNSLNREMQEASKNHEYEEAARVRDLIKKIEYVTKSFRDPEEYIDNPYLVEDMISNSLDELVANIPYLNRIPKRIECYDISNTSGKEATGSMVVATDGRIDKSQYRKFKIKFKDSPDDFEMMREVLRRRFKNAWPHPDLLVVDGGKGQVTAATQVLAELKLDICLVGLAKRFETIVLSDLSEVLLDRTNPGLKLLQRLRDEAHRFAKTYHMKLRLKKFTEKKI